MRKIILSIVLVASIGLVSCKNESKKETATKLVSTTEATFGVRGNCGMCKNTIEKAANGVEGVASANWDKARKQIKVSFDASKTNLDTIHKAVAASGYDTDKVLASAGTYDNLPGCCQYDNNMEMSLKGEVKEDDKAVH